MAMLGLQQAGKNPTRQSFVDSVHKVGTYDGAGLTCTQLDVSLENYGKSRRRAARGSSREGRQVRLFNKGKPVQGKLVGAADLLKANSEGALSATTTTPPTTAAP